MTEALYIGDGDRFIPTELTRGGWTDDAQHGGPPSGLLGRFLEAVPTAVPMQIVRCTIDLFRPIPLRPLSVATHVRRDGRRIQIVDASLFDGDVQLGRATALKIRTTAIDLPHANVPWVEPAGPETVDVLQWEGYGGKAMSRFHYDAVEIRSVDDSFIANRPGLSWFRMKSELVAGEELTPFTRLATLADMANGNSRALDPDRWLFVNPDITIYCHRLPEGEYVGMHSAATQEPTGIGVTDSWLFDQVGPLGRINQAQLIEPRAT
jgi:acyl-Coa thioesterase superfamily protein/acyl-CoA thioesterase superfamily protein